MYKTTLVILIVISFFGCKNSKVKITEIQLESIKNEKLVTVSELLREKYSVVTFFSPECPLSENYTKTLNAIQDSFQNKGVSFITVFPGDFYSNEKILSFIADYKLHQINVRDKKLEFATALNASTTPETFILNRNAEILYSGAIDNWATALGEKRQVITEFYLIDALNALINNQPVSISQTTPIGCFIEIKE